ncbi:MAG: replication initiator protein [Microvirus sp.]|nr:MAG: replication initiator protein [Microvirus sp.]
MACYKPLKAWRVPARPGSPPSLTFNRNIGAVDLPQVNVPCGRCIGCRISRAKEWAARLADEATLHSDVWFLTFTYSDEHLPANRSLSKETMQKAIKRMRKNIGLFRYYLCGEYGDLFGRPHYHMICFGLKFDSLKLVSLRKRLYNNDLLTKSWGFGHVTIQYATPKTMEYTARYVLKKQWGSKAEAHYNGLLPEFNMMSLKPAIGRNYALSNSGDFIHKGYYHLNGSKVKLPKYYKKLYELTEPDLIAILKAKARAAYRPEDNTPKRLEQREECAKARASRFTRNYEDGGFLL